MPTTWTMGGAIGFTAAVALAIAFQLALMFGAPWGAYAMGGAFPGRLPPTMRVAAGVQACFLAGLAAVVLDRTGFPAGVPYLGEWAIWGVVGVSVASLILNLVTPSKGERAVWAPVATVMVLTSAMVAIGG